MPALTIVPANEASWDDLVAIFGERGDPANCQCQWFKATRQEFRDGSKESFAPLLREQTQCGHPSSSTTSGIVAYRDGEPVGWCAVEPRTEYVRMRTQRVPWLGRDEDKDDSSVWVVSCFVVRKGFRRQGISRALAAATVDFARDRGARAIEGYPMEPEPGKEVIWGQLYIGSRSIFADAGFREVSRPTPRRMVMRIDF